MFDNLKSLGDRVGKIKQEMVVEGKSVIKDTLKELFAAFPMIESVKWTQYTPYFNDGDACEFSVNDVEIKLGGAIGKAIEASEEDDDDERGWINLEYDNVDNVDGIDKLTKNALSKAIKSLNEGFQDLEDAMYESFGDHVEIVATRTSIDVNECSHD